jgi:hypothetical protein
MMQGFYEILACIEEWKQDGDLLQTDTLLVIALIL